MIEKIIDFSARNVFLIFVFVIILFAAGIWSVYNVPKDAIPDLTDTQVIIFTEWMGRSPNLVEDQITYPITSSLLSAPNVKVVRGYSMNSMSFVYVIFEDGTDLYWARSRVLEYLQTIQDRLPPGVNPTLAPDATGLGWVYQYALVDRSGQHDLAELRSLQDWYLRYWLLSVPGVSEVASLGGFEKQYQLDLDPNKLAAYNLSIDQIIRAIPRSNQEVGGRVIEMTGREYRVRGRGYVESIGEIEKIAVGADANGTPIVLGDVANIHLGPQLRLGASDFNGEGEAVGGIVVMRSGENALSVIEDVKEKLADIKKSLPPGVEIVPVYDRSDLILRSIHTLKRSLIEEGVIVSLVIIIFLLHIPSALRAILILPIAVVSAFIPMYFMGITSNIMSLGGIAIAIGVLVDSAVIMIENVQKKLEHLPEGAPASERKEIVIQACKEVGRPLFFSLLIITISFLPVFTLESQEGRLFKPLAFTKTFSMAGAALLSITLAPALMVLLMIGRVIPEAKHPISRMLQRVYYPWVNALMRRRLLSITIAVIVVISAFPLLPIVHDRFLPKFIREWKPVKEFKLGTEFMPPLNEGSILYMPTTLPGISLPEATKYLQLQDRLIRQVPEVETVFGKVGKADTATDPAPFEMVETTVMFKPEKDWRKVPLKRWYSGLPNWMKPPFRLLQPEERHITFEELRDELNAAVSIPAWTDYWGMPIEVRIGMLTTGIRTPVGIKIFGDDLKQIEHIGEQLEQIISKVDGAQSVFAERVTGGYYIDIIPRREAAARYGMTIGDLFDVVQTAVGGMTIDTTIEGKERYTINLRYARDYRNDLQALKRVLVPISTGGMSGMSMGSSMSTGMGGSMSGSSMSTASMSGSQLRTRNTPPVKQIPLSELADIKVITGPAMIKNEDASTTGWVYIDVAGRDLGGFVNDAKQAVNQQLKLPPNYTLVWTGNYESMERVGKRMMIVVPITLAIIFIMLFMNFQSLGATLIVLLSLPFALTGSLWMLHLYHFNLSIAVWVGIIALAGVAAETGVIMIVYLDEAFHMFRDMGRMRHQYDLFTAITYGAVQRVRPKLMTVMCILMGLVPLMWAHGAGADVMRRIAAPMIGGVITSSILTLEIVPAIYSLWRGRQVPKVRLRPLGEGETVTYSCPFHPEESSALHRQCSDCGMYLQEDIEDRII